MNKFCNVLLMLELGLSQLAFCMPSETVRFYIKNKKMTAGINRFQRPIHVDDQYFNVADDDSYDGWEPARLMRDSARLFAYTKTWGKAFDATALKSWYSPRRPISASVEPAVTWIGHSTFLIHLKNLILLLIRYSEAHHGFIPVQSILV